MSEKVSLDDPLIQDLRSLGKVRAPARLAARVIEQAGLAELYFTMDSPIGHIAVWFRDGQITAVMPAEEASRGIRPGRPAASPPLALQRAVERLLSGAAAPLPPVELAGLSPFQRAVLEKTAEIPRGEIRTYGWIAAAIGRPGAVRAVGSALHRNPIPLIIPCHRVVRAGGSIGEYGFGAEAKRRLLAFEGVLIDNADAPMVTTSFVGSQTTGIFCRPDCRHARRIDAVHRIGFPSASAATAAGYRPCRVCQPAGNATAHAAPAQH